MADVLKPAPGRPYLCTVQGARTKVGPDVHADQEQHAALLMRLQVFTPSTCSSTNGAAAARWSFCGTLIICIQCQALRAQHSISHAPDAACSMAQPKAVQAGPCASVQALYNSLRVPRRSSETGGVHTSAGTGMVHRPSTIRTHVIAAGASRASLRPSVCTALHHIDTISYNVPASVVARESGCMRSK